MTAVKGDVTRMDDLNHLFSIIQQEKGRLDILFANADMATLAPFSLITEKAV